MDWNIITPILFTLIAIGVFYFLFLKKKLKPIDVSGFENQITTLTKEIENQRQSRKQEIEALEKQIKENPPVQNIKIENGKESNPNILVVDKDIDLKGGELELPDAVIFRGGVFSNGSLKGNNTYLDVGLFDCFRNIKFKGIWRVREVAPDNFGAAPNECCSDAIQQAIDSPFHVSYSGAHYYMTKPVVIDKPKSISLVPGLHTDEDADRNYPFEYEQDHTRIWTDKDIDLFVINHKQTRFVGGVMDTSKIDKHTKDVFRIPLNKRVSGLYIDTIYEGNKNTLGLEGIGTTCIHMDTDVTEKDGYLSDCKFFGRAINVKKAVYMPKTIPGMETWSTSHRIDMNVDGCKMAFDIRTGSKLEIKGHIQSRYSLAESEIDFPMAYFGCHESTIDVFPWDVRGYDSDSAPYGHKLPVIVDAGSNNKFLQPLEPQFYQRKGNVPSQGEPIIDPPNSIITKSGVMISHLHNQLIAADKRYEVTIRTSDNVLFQHRDQLWLVNPSATPSIWFQDGSDLEKAFAEIEIKGNLGRFRDLILKIKGDNYKSGHSNHFNTIDVFTTKNGKETVYTNFPDRHTELFKYELGDIDGLRIRMTGSQAHNIRMKILEVYGGKENSNFSPTITVNGPPQKIYGTLEIDNLIVNGRKI